MSENMRTEQDRLIEEFMAGTMSPAAQREFDRRLEGDPSLRRLLDAELEIARAVRRNLGAIPKVQSTMSASLLARIAETAPVASQAPSGAGATIGSAAWSWVITAIVLCGVGGGLLLSSNQTNHRTDTAVDSTTRSAPALTSPSIPPAPEQSSRLDSNGRMHSGDNRAPIRDSVVAMPRSAPASVASGPSRPARPTPDRPKAPKQDDERAIREYMDQKEKSAVAPVEVNDKIRTTVEMDPKRP